MANAKLIVVESLDGGGKTTQSNLIKKYLDQQKVKYEYIHFPIYGNNEGSQVVAAYLRGEFGDIDKVNPIFVANIYAMDRFLYLPELKRKMQRSFDGDNLKSNDVILLDRYVFSNMAYQGAKYNTETQSQIMRDWIDEFEFGFLELPYPDLNIFFDVPIEQIEKRLNRNREGNDRTYLNGKLDIHEKNIEFQKKVRENYLALKCYDNFLVVETDDLSPEDIFKKYVDRIEKLLMIQ
jgi:dTMP kinase